MTSNQSTPAQRKISVVIALVLLSACAAKAWAMVWLTIPVTRLESFFNVLIIQLELVLALWLLSRKRLTASLAASAIFFLLASASNVRAIWLSKTSCGCFGNIEIPPGVTLVLNVAFLLGIAHAFRTSKASFTSVFKITRIGWTIPICICVFVVSVLFQLGRIHFAPKVLAIPEVVDFGVIELGLSKEMTIPLKNIAAKQINIWGGRTNCSCASIEGLPALLPRDSEKEVRIVVTPRNLRDIDVMAIFYVDSGVADNSVAIIAKVADPNQSK